LLSAVVAVAAMIIKRRSGHFDPTTFRDRYQWTHQLEEFAASARDR
jgi:hypothetical protein